MYHKPDYTPIRPITKVSSVMKTRASEQSSVIVAMKRYKKSLHLRTTFLSKIRCSITPVAYFSTAIASSLVAFKQ
jgi:hypothetical protein